MKPPPTMTGHEEASVYITPILAGAGAKVGGSGTSARWPCFTPPEQWSPSPSL
jgi:hypothetical protein